MTESASVVVAVAALFSRLNDRCILSRILSANEHLASTFYHCKTHWNYRTNQVVVKDVALKKIFGSFNNPTGALFTDVITATVFFRWDISVIFC